MAALYGSSRGMRAPREDRAEGTEAEMNKQHRVEWSGTHGCLCFSQEAQGSRRHAAAKGWMWVSLRVVFT